MPCVGSEVKPIGDVRKGIQSK